MGGERGCLKMRDQELCGGVEEIPVQEILGIPSNLVGLFQGKRNPLMPPCQISLSDMKSWKR